MLSSSSISIVAVAGLVANLAFSTALVLPQNSTGGGITADSSSGTTDPDCNKSPPASGVIPIGEDCSLLIRSSLVARSESDDKKETFFRSDGQIEPPDDWVKLPITERNRPPWAHGRGSCKLVVTTLAPNVIGIATWLELAMAAARIVKGCVNSGPGYGGTIDAGQWGHMQIRLEGQSGIAEQQPSLPLLHGAVNSSAAMNHIASSNLTAWQKE